MAVLTTRQRKRLPKSAFGLPGERAYPMPDREHAANAKARATQMVRKGKLSPAAAAKIRAKADRVLARGAKKRGPTPRGEAELRRAARKIARMRSG